MVSVALHHSVTASASDLYYLSVPGLCNAGDGELEESNAIILSDRSMGNHSFDCSFDKPIGKSLQKERWVETEANCENSTGSW